MTTRASRGRLSSSARPRIGFAIRLANRARLQITRHLQASGRDCARQVRSGSTSVAAAFSTPPSASSHAANEHATKASSANTLDRGAIAGKRACGDLHAGGRARRARECVAGQGTPWSSMTQDSRPTPRDPAIAFTEDLTQAEVGAGLATRRSSTRGAREHQTPCLRASWLRARAISWGAVRLPNSALRPSSRTDWR